MPYNITANIITCPSCGATQKTKASKKAMSARLCADVDGTETWYTAFTDVLKSLIFKDKQESNLTSDQISEALLSVENVTMLVDGSSNYVKDIVEPEPLKWTSQIVTNDTNVIDSVLTWTSSHSHKCEWQLAFRYKL